MIKISRSSVYLK